MGEDRAVWAWILFCGLNPHNPAVWAKICASTIAHFITLPRYQTSPFLGSSRCQTDRPGVRPIFLAVSHAFTSNRLVLPLRPAGNSICQCVLTRAYCLF